MSHHQHFSSLKELRNMSFTLSHALNRGYLYTSKQISKEDELACVVAAQNHDSRAIHTLFQSLRDVIFHNLKDIHPKGLAPEIDEIVDKIYIKMLMLLDAFDASKGCSFRTYMNKPIQTTIADTYREYMSSDVNAKITDNDQEIEDDVNAYGEECFPTLLPKLIKRDEDDNFQYWDDEDESGEDSPSDGSFVPDFFIQTEYEEKLRTASLNQLPTRQAEIIRLLFGLDDRDKHTVSDVAQQLGISHQRVCQLRDAALQQMRQSSYIRMRVA